MVINSNTNCTGHNFIIIKIISKVKDRDFRGIHPFELEESYLILGNSFIIVLCKIVFELNDGL